jgi:hypothetical protein
MRTVDGASVMKYHPVFGSILKVALEVAFNIMPDGDELVIVDSRFYNNQLIHQGVNFTKAYYPAKIEGSIGDGDDKSTIEFVPWLDEDGAVYHRICFRFGNDRLDTLVRVLFAREGEEKPFGFEQNHAAYINLDFCSKREEFLPLFVIIDDGEKTTYLKIEGGGSENRTFVTINRVTMEEVPEHLKF